MKDLAHSLLKLDSISLSLIQNIIEDYENYRMEVATKLDNLDPCNPQSYITLLEEFNTLQKGYERMLQKGYDRIGLTDQITRMKIYKNILEQIRQDAVKGGLLSE